MARIPLMAGNWKMNLNHIEAIALVQKLAYTFNAEDFAALEIAVIPPFTDIRSVQTLVDGDKIALKYGAQDLAKADKGAFTGEISGPMLAKLGCTFVIVGHSERREYHGENDQTVNLKVQAALRNGITPIVCVGEGSEVRNAGEQVSHTLRQLDAALAGVSSKDVANLVIAYEPVWAIGTGEVATPADAQEVCGAIRDQIRKAHGSAADQVRVLYGGSMKADNVAALMKEPDIDGGLVGGASLDPDEFVSVCRYRMHP
ncbi:MAG: triose-phosphate isomerase [Actinobacteria bacterium]|uniref:triose-phosphate isomerase n=1 Tax=freshwater metagenome TaxID=449393 RepID=A0A6J6T2L1_9ZZZZ|nr:triose-phosphate isomerase [Actinomycetota bacterium]